MGRAEGPKNRFWMLREGYRESARKLLVEMRERGWKESPGDRERVLVARANAAKHMGAERLPLLDVAGHTRHSEQSLLQCREEFLRRGLIGDLCARYQRERYQGEKAGDRLPQSWPGHPTDRRSAAGRPRYYQGSTGGRPLRRATNRAAVRLERVVNPRAGGRSAATPCWAARYAISRGNKRELRKRVVIPTSPHDWVILTEGTAAAPPYRYLPRSLASHRRI